MSKNVVSAVLVAGLLSITATTHASSASFSNETTGFLFQNVTDLWTEAFEVDNAIDGKGVEVFAYVYRDGWTHTYSFDPFLVVWDANGNIVLDISGNKAYNDNINQLGAYDSYINLGNMDNGIYYVTIGNSPNKPVKDTVDFNNISDSFSYGTADPSDLYGIWGITTNVTGQWSMHISGASAAPVPVPEPETWAMLLAGLSIVSIAARKQHTRTAA
jgi:hypothetical protein